MVEMKYLKFSAELVVIGLLLGLARPVYADDKAAEIVRASIDYWRGASSYTEAEMKIIRPGWSRKLAFRAWSKGMDKSLIRFTAPAKDAGTASLTLEDDMWSFSPKINRVIRIPPSMRGQSWMGSDFSYQDLAKVDDIVRRYHHQILKEEKNDLGMSIYLIESIPKENAPVVWGKEHLLIREDYIMLEHVFFDQDGKLIKRLISEDITMIGGRLYPRVMKMIQVENPGESTEVIHKSIDFRPELNQSLFTLSSLRNPR